MSINAQIENMPVHLINRRSRQNRRAPESKHKYQGRQRNTWRSRFQSTHAGEVKPEAPDDKTAAWTERCSRAESLNKSTANVLRRFNVHLFLTRGTYSIKISY